MYNKERFDEPTSYYGDWGEGQSTQEKAISAIKRLLPLLVVLIVFASIAWFAFDFFVGSVKKVSFTVENTEGELLSDASIRVFSVSGEEVFRGAGNAVHTVELRKGSYFVDAGASGYASKSRSPISIGDSSSAETIVLEKNIPVEIVGLENAFPSSLVAGQKAQASFELKNSGGRAVEAELVFSGDLEKISIKSLPSVIVVPQGSSSSVVLEIEVPRDIKIDLKKETVLKGEARVKYTGESQSVEFSLFPAPQLELAKTDFGRLGAGKTADRDVRVSNRSGFAVSGLKLYVEITSAPVNSASEVLKWFKFSEVANSEQPFMIDVPLLGKSGTVEKKLRVDVPLTAKKEVVSGSIVLEASFLQEPIRSALEIEVSLEAVVVLQALVRPDSVSINWIDEQGKYEEKPVTVEFRNNGALSIENILLSVSNPSTCHIGWLRLEEKTIPELAPRENTELIVFVSSPAEVRGNESTMNCKLSFEYDNPSPIGLSRIEEKIEGFLAITPRG